MGCSGSKPATEGDRTTKKAFTAAAVDDTVNADGVRKVCWPIAPLPPMLAHLAHGCHRAPPAASNAALTVPRVPWIWQAISLIGGEPPPFDMMPTLMKRFDGNGDDRLTLDEFMKLVSFIHTHGMESIDALPVPAVSPTSVVPPAAPTPTPPAAPAPPAAATSPPPVMPDPYYSSNYAAATSTAEPAGSSAGAAAESAASPPLAPPPLAPLPLAPPPLTPPTLTPPPLTPPPLTPPALAPPALAPPALAPPALTPPPLAPPALTPPPLAPPALTPPPLVPPPIVAAAAAAPSSAAAAAAPSLPNKALPAGWEAVNDSVGRTYYWNSDTDEVSWVVPTAPAASSKGKPTASDAAIVARALAAVPANAATVAGGERRLFAAEDDDTVDGGAAEGAAEGEGGTSTDEVRIDGMMEGEAVEADQTEEDAVAEQRQPESHLRSGNLNLRRTQFLQAAEDAAADPRAKEAAQQTRTSIVDKGRGIFSAGSEVVPASAPRASSMPMSISEKLKALERGGVTDKPQGEPSAHQGASSQHKMALAALERKAAKATETKSSATQRAVALRGLEQASDAECR